MDEPEEGARSETDEEGVGQPGDLGQRIEVRDDAGDRRRQDQLSGRDFSAMASMSGNDLAHLIEGEKEDGEQHAGKDLENMLEREPPCDAA